MRGKIVRIIRECKLSKPILHCAFVNGGELCTGQPCELSRRCELARVKLSGLYCSFLLCWSIMPRNHSNISRCYCGHRSLIYSIFIYISSTESKPYWLLVTNCSLILQITESTPEFHFINANNETLHVIVFLYYKTMSKQKVNITILLLSILYPFQKQII